MMNKKNITIIACLIFMFVIGIAVAQIFDLNLSFFEANNEEIEYVYAVDGAILTNIRNSRSFVKTEVILTVMCKDEVDNMKHNSFKIRDLIIDVLRSMEEYEYYEDSLQETLNERIIARLTDDLGYEHIKRVYFKDLITQ